MNRAVRDSRFYACELFSLWRAREATGAEIPEKFPNARGRPLPFVNLLHFSGISTPVASLALEGENNS